MTKMPSVTSSDANAPPLSSEFLKFAGEAEPVMPLTMPVTLVLNTIGLSMLKNRGAQGGEKGFSGYELPVNAYKPDMVRKLLDRDCLKRIDVRLDDVISHRRDIMDLFKLLTFATLYRQFRRELLEKTLKTGLVRQWNRNHPRWKLDASSESSMDALKRKLNARPEQLALYRRNMMILLWKNHHGRFLGDDQKKKLGMAGKLITEMHPMTEFILVNYGKIDEVRRLQEEAASLIAAYVERFDLPEYQALVLLEFLQTSERDHLLTLYKRILENGGRSPDDYPLNEQIRQELIKRKVSAETRFSFLFETKNSSRRGLSYRIRTMVSCGEHESKELNDILFHRDNSRLDKRGVRDYLEQGGCGDDRYNPEILYYYMSHLEEACRKTGCSFSSFINSRAGITMIHLLFDC